MATVESTARASFQADTTHGSLLIGEQWCEADSGERFDVVDPATEAVIGSSAAAGTSDVNKAVHAARRAFDSGVWSGLPPAQRARVLSRIGDLIEENAAELAVAETRENGMPIVFAHWSMAAVAELFRYYAGWVTKIGGQTIEVSAVPDIHAYTLREPIGVAAMIIPWNGPLLMATQKLAPALAAGCTCVLKPAENTPLNVLNLAKLMLSAGLPAGVLNIVNGYGHVAGAALAAHDGVDKIAFTGSTATGREIARAATGNLKRVSLELGGKSPIIVCDDADIAQAVPAILNAIMINSGQACIAGSRLYAQRSIYAPLMQALADAAGKMSVGNGFEDGVQIGPVISQRQRDRIMDYIEGGIADGAELVVGGARAFDRGYFVQPTILGNVGQNSTVSREEIFGPVLAAAAFDTLDEAVTLANDTQYGLSGGIFTRSVSTAHKVAKRLRGGYLFVNTYSILDPAVPFGGYKQSGWGRELGREGLDAFLETKSVFVQL